ncbi:MAG: LamG-like jellyroll fold domain-containing protein [archaeon]|jgi:prepilin-type N-terminal cleavage/methylation domain-containing protein
MNRRGFTLIELLVVIAIVGILSSVIYTNITGLRDRARVTAGTRFDSSTLHSIGDMLVGEWLFDTNTSPTLDTSGSGNSGTLVGTPTWQETGGYNSKGAYSFNGSTNYVSMGDVLDFDSGDKFTISAWIKPNTGTTGNVVTKESNITPYKGYGIYVGPSGKIYFELINTVTTNSLRIYGTKNTADGQWHHVATTYDGSKTVAGTKIYIDGANDDIISVTANTLTGDTLTSYPLEIGARNGAYYPFTGSIDNVRIYANNLSGSDIQKIYAEGISSHSNLANK